MRKTMLSVGDMYRTSGLSIVYFTRPATTLLDDWYVADRNIIFTVVRVIDPEQLQMTMYKLLSPEYGISYTHEINLTLVLAGELDSSEALLTPSRREEIRLIANV